MKSTKHLLLAALLAVLSVGFLSGCACTSKSNPKMNAQAKAYPLNYCLVSSEKLGDTGKNFTMNYQGQQITFCCKDCVNKFNADPEKYMQKLADAENQNTANK